MAVRPEYQALVDGLPALMAPFGGMLADRERADLAVLMAAMERVDAELDAMRDPDARRAFGDAVVRALSSPSPTPTRDDELAALAAVTARRGISLAGLVRDALANTERMRQARDVATYLACVEREGELTVALALSLFAPPTRFVQFFRAVAPLANLVDKLVDARADFAEGTLAIPPGIPLAARLVARIAAHAPRVVASHPDRLALVRWGAAWLRALGRTVALR